MHRRLFVLGSVLLSLTAGAEAGSPYQFCGETSCACQMTTCTCGQACNHATGRCEAAQAAYCGSDAMCAASCGSFICEGNVCVEGLRTDGGDGTQRPANAGGCASAPELLAVLAAALLRRGSERRRRVDHVHTPGGVGVDVVQPATAHRRVIG